MAGLSYNKARTTGHSNFPPTIINASQSKVFVDGIAVLVQGDKITPHTRTSEPHDTHDGEAIASTSKVFVVGKPAIQMGDRISCGDTVAQSSSKTFIQ